MRIPVRCVAWFGAAAWLVLLAVAAPEASAANLTVISWERGERVNVVGPGRTGWVDTAELTVSFMGEQGFSYCVDLAQSIGAGTTAGWESRELTPSITRAAWLVETFRPQFDSLEFGGRSVNQTTAIAALQVAIWEVLSDSLGHYDLYSGGFRIANGGASAGVMNLSRMFLGELSNADFTSYGTSATFAWNSRRQDQIVINPIPEPSSVGLFLAGAGLIGWVASRKRA